MYLSEQFRGSPVLLVYIRHPLGVGRHNYWLWTIQGQGFGFSHVHAGREPYGLAAPWSKLKSAAEGVKVSVGRSILPLEKLRV